MLIDSKNQSTAEELFNLDPYDLNLPLFICEMAGRTYVGNVILIGDDYWMVDPYLYDKKKRTYISLGITFVLTGYGIIRTTNTDEIKLYNKDLFLGIGIMSGTVFTTQNRIH